MEDFEWEKKETYTKEDIEKILFKHKEVVSGQIKNEYESKLNAYQEKEIFNGFNEKQIKIAKSLYATDDYKNLSKEEAYNKIKTDYQDIFNPKLPEKPVEKIVLEPSKSPEMVFNPKTLVDLHNTNSPIAKFKELEEKGKKGKLTDAEIEEHASFVLQRALREGN